MNPLHLLVCLNENVSEGLLSVVVTDYVGRALLKLCLWLGERELPASGALLASRVGWGGGALLGFPRELPFSIYMGLGTQPATNVPSLFP